MGSEGMRASDSRVCDADATLLLDITCASTSAVSATALATTEAAYQLDSF